MVSLVLFQFILLSAPIFLSGNGQPVHLMEGVAKSKNRIIWIVRQTDGKSPELWRMDGRLSRVKLPENAQYVIPHPGEDTLFIVEPGRVLKWNFKEHERKEDIWIDKVLPLEKLPSWVPGFYHGSSLFLPSRGKMVVIHNDQSRLIQEYKFHQDVSGAGFHETEFAFPHPIEWNERVYWTDEHVLFSLSEKLAKTPFPSVGVMERAIPVFAAPAFDWFIFGGQRGDLDSFGWRLQDQQVSGRGILTRFAQDPSGKRLFFTTISNKVSSHLYASMMGKRYFKVHVFEKRKEGWVRIQKREFGLKKTKGLFGIYWPGDWNGDGLIDMVVSDKSHGFRVFPAIEGSGFSRESRTLSKSPLKLFSLGSGFAWSERKDQAWLIHLSDGGVQ